MRRNHVAGELQLHVRHRECGTVVAIHPRQSNVNNVRQPKLGRNVCRRGIPRQLFIARSPVLSACLYEAVDEADVSVFTVHERRRRCYNITISVEL